MAAGSLKFSSYGLQGEVHIIAKQVRAWSSYEANGFPGTTITMHDGQLIVVRERVEVVGNAITQTLKEFGK